MSRLWLRNGGAAAVQAAGGRAAEEAGDLVAQPHLSSTALGVVLAVVAGVFYGVTKMYGKRMDRAAEKRDGRGERPEDGRGRRG